MQMKKIRSPRWLDGRAQIGWLLAVTVLAFGLLMSQRPSRKYPSPADPGMQLAQPRPKAPHDPRGAQNDPKPENPDPGAGDGPDIDDDARDAEPRLDEKADYPPPLENDGPELDSDEPTGVIPKIKVDRMEALRVAMGSEFGKPDDWVLVLHGAGYLDGEGTPIVHLGTTIALKEVFVNRGGSELFAVLPLPVRIMLGKADLDNVAVQNPGGLNRDPKEWGRLAVDKTAFLANLEQAERVKFKHGLYFLERVPAQ
jgi:hypothetical protein